MKPDEAMDLLREAHREPIPEAHFAAVRARVLSQIAAERGVSRRRTWRYAFAVAVAAALFLAFWPKQQAPRRVVSEVRPPIERPLASARGSVSSYHGERMAAAVRRGARRKPAVTGVIGPPNPTPLVVKILTNDPTVVIYWISAGTGE
jgi:hypothetical protein